MLIQKKKYCTVLPAYAVCGPTEVITISYRVLIFVGYVSFLLVLCLPCAPWSIEQSDSSLGS